MNNQDKLTAFYEKLTKINNDNSKTKYNNIIIALQKIIHDTLFNGIIVIDKTKNFLILAEIVLDELYKNIYNIINEKNKELKVDNVVIPLLSGAIFANGYKDFIEMVNRVYNNFIKYVANNPIGNTKFYFSNNDIIDKKYPRPDITNNNIIYYEPFNINENSTDIGKDEFYKKYKFNNK
jgi:hypothetical protein